MNTRSILTVVVTVIAFSWTEVVAAEHDTELAAQFVKSVKDAAQVLDKAELHVKCETIDESNLVGEERHRSTRSNEIAIRAGMVLSRSDSGVFAVNDHYMFSARRVRNKWVRMDDGGNLIPSKRSLRRFTHDIRHQALSAYYIGSVHGVQLSDLVSSDGFEVTHAAKVGNRVEIHFEHSPSGRMRRISDAYLVCDPSKDWAILEYSATFNSGDVESTCTGENTIGERVDGVRLVDKAETTMLLPNAKAVIRKVRIITPIGTEVPQDQFFLTHYGIAEPKP